MMMMEIAMKVCTLWREQCRRSARDARGVGYMGAGEAVVEVVLPNVVDVVDEELAEEDLSDVMKW